MAMGLAGASFCNFVVYTFGGIIISRMDFDHTYFVDLMQKINSFYRMHCYQNYYKSLEAITKILMTQTYLNMLSVSVPACVCLPVCPCLFVCACVCVCVCVGGWEGVDGF